MSIRQFRPMTAGTRFRSVSGFDEITRATPEKSLLEPKRRSGGRNNKGHVTMRALGGGHKQQYRKIDFRRNKFGIPARVTEIEYDPNRSARIALLVYADGEKRYILHPAGLKQGDVVVSGPGSDARLGNALPLGEIPLGTTVHNVEIRLGRGGQLARSAGQQAQVMAREGEYVTSASSPARCGWCTPSAWPRSAKWATVSTSSSPAARRARPAGWGVAARCAAWPRTRWITPWAAARARARAAARRPTPGATPRA